MEIDRFHIGLVERVVRWTFVAAAALIIVALVIDRRAAFGLSLGVSLGLLLVCLHRQLFSGLIRSQKKLCGMVGCWALWALKWPLLGILLYFSIKSGELALGPFCIGVSLIPAVATALALRALLIDTWRTVRARL